MIVTLGHIGEQGMRDPRELLDPFVTIFIELRAHLRNEGRFDEADTIRNRLASIGIALRDGESGTEWLQEPK
jgi:cysteinyl-tRNA synthetase